MVDEPDSLILRLMRRIDEKLDRLIDDVSDLKYRMTSVERQLADVRGDIAGFTRRIDKLEARFDRLERRFDLTSG